jgi:tRNA1Val (adenine37-N6)-methyltransferase
MFRFKQFAIRQENAAMKVGTDGALLGAWCDVSKANNILDIGTGTAIISMMVAQRNSTAAITAIEIDEKAITDANFNVKNCPWSNRIKIIQSSLQEFIPNLKFDSIISNPPFFENSLKSNSKSKIKARHTDSLHYSDILNFASIHLSNIGVLHLILPVENAEKCIETAIEGGFYLKRICKVHPVPNKNAHRFLFELTKKATPTITESLIIETGKRHDYSQDYIALTKGFYTIM